MWRGKHISGDFRKLSRTTLTKYVYALFFIEMGYTAFFFDTDSFWMRKAILPPNNGTYDMLGMVESPTRHATRNDTVMTELHNFQRINFLYKLREYTWCGKHIDYFPITSGVWVMYPTEWSFRFVANYLDFMLFAWDFWWEQNLWSYMLIQYTGWGLRWGNLRGDSFTGGNRGLLKSKNDCESSVGKFVWVHTKHVKESYAACKQNPIWEPPADHMDVIPGDVTLRLLDDV
jgi:hypothetical protein